MVACYVNGVVRADYGWLNKAGGANSVVLMGSLPRWLRKNLDAFPGENCFSMPILWSRCGGKNISRRWELHR